MHQTVCVGFASGVAPFTDNTGSRQLHYLLDTPCDASRTWKEMTNTNDDDQWFERGKGEFLLTNYSQKGCC